MSRTAKVRWPFALVSVLTLIVVHHLAGLRTSISSAASSNQQNTIIVDSPSPSYLVHVPPGYDDHSSRPLGLVVQGAGPSSHNAPSYDGYIQSDVCAQPICVQAPDSRLNCPETTPNPHLSSSYESPIPARALPRGCTAPPNVSATHSRR